ncbi:LacI family DNA-binding transcriptional regulator [Microbacterium sp. MAHUQ-60]|uniref:LacI family DNA-binding transcriptional regulator n=1 Tax=unclassified Microbacterium TaxID=2609290 RepID=UPI0036170030
MDRVRAPNIRDVARLAGVSYQTVSRVLNDSPNIRSVTRDRVLTAIAELGYRPNQAARALVTSRSQTIGVLTSMSVHYGPTTAINALEVSAREAGFRTSLTTLASSDDASIRSSLDFLMSQRIEGLVVIAPQERILHALDEAAVTIPTITLDTSGRAGAHSVGVDQVAGARLAMEHLIALGHTDIVHIAGPRDWIEADARMRGYLQTLSDADLRTRAPILGDWSAGFGYHAGRELLRYRDFTAVFAGNDQMALGFLHACREAGIETPDQMSVVGFDDIPEAAHFAPPLTTIRQDFAEIGRRAMSMMLGLIGGERAEPTQIAPELVRRSSTAPPPH